MTEQSWHRYDGDHDCWSAGCDVDKTVFVTPTPLGDYEIREGEYGPLNKPDPMTDDAATPAQPRTAADQMREWLVWAEKRMLGVPQPEIIDRIEAQARPAVASETRCTFHHSWGPVCGKPPDDASVHSRGAEPMRPGTHLWRHDFKDAHRLASDTGSVGALDVERLWRAIEGMGLIEYGQLVPFEREDAERIAAAYAATGEGEQ